VLRVALTGGIACGKSVVAQILAEKGCVVESADDVARDLVAPGTPAWKKIVRRFGGKILRPDGTIDRKRLAAILFAEPGARDFLNRLLHPLVMKERKRTVSRLEKEGRTKIYVVEAALTIEAGTARFYDRIVVVHCPEPVQTRRLMERDGLDPAEAEKRISAQMPQSEKLRYADYTIDSAGSLAETVDQAEALYARLILDSELKTGGAARRRRHGGLNRPGFWK
jgi:dephospho-CoA kinase